MNSKKIPLLLTLALFIVSFGVSPEAKALTVSPVKMELEGAPGNVLSTDFRLINDQDQSVTFYGSFENFEAQGETGTPNFTTGGTDLASWATLVPPESGEDPTVITLGPGEEITRYLRVQIPMDATPGGHFAALFWSTTPPNEDDSLNIGAKVGILMFLSVEGDFETGGDLLSFQAGDARNVFNSLPLTFSYRFQNTGADRVVPEGSIEIRNLLGLPSDILPINTGLNNVLPASARKFEETWGNTAFTTQGFLGAIQNEWHNFAFGRYTATLTLKTDPNGEENAQTVHFWVFPWQLLSVLLVACSALFFSLRLGILRYNRWILKNALKNRKRTKRSK